MGEAIRTAVKAPETKKENQVSQVQKGNFCQPLSSPVEQILFLQRTIGNQAVQKLMKSGALQAKLRIGAPGDVYEQEADRVAEQVMRMPDPLIQSKPALQSAKGCMPNEKNQIEVETITRQVVPLIQRQNQIPKDDERQFWLSLGKQPHYGVLEMKKRTPMAIETGNQAADEILWNLEALLTKAEQMRIFLKAKFGEDKDLRVTSVVKAGEHTGYRKMDVVPDGSTTWEELAAAAVHAGFWVHAEGVSLYGKLWPLSPNATGPHFDLYLIGRELGDFPEPLTGETGGDKMVQTKGMTPIVPEIRQNFEIQLNDLKGGGNLLPKSERDFFETRFGHDFSHVRIHTDSNAEDLSQNLKARAFTWGKDIFFGKGQYSPGTNSGNRLLSHELVHVIQQNTKGASYSKDVNDVSAGAKNRETDIKQFKKPPGDQIQLVKLTYDDGPDTAGNTKIVLEELKKSGASATFYLVGQRVNEGENWRTVFDIAAGGNWLGNHAFDWNNAADEHIWLTGTPEERAQKIRLTELAIRNALIKGKAEAKASNSWEKIQVENRQYIDDVIKNGTGRFRTPGFKSKWWRKDESKTGAAISQVNKILANEGMRILEVSDKFDIDIDPKDWIKGKTKEEIEKAVTEELKKGSETILLHSRILATAEATPHIIETIKKQGWTFEAPPRGGGQIATSYSEYEKEIGGLPVDKSISFGFDIKARTREFKDRPPGERTEIKLDRSGAVTVICDAYLDYREEIAKQIEEEYERSRRSGERWEGIDVEHIQKTGPQNYTIGLYPKNYPMDSESRFNIGKKEFFTWHKVEPGAYYLEIYWLGGQSHPVFKLVGSGEIKVKYGN